MARLICPKDLLRFVARRWFVNARHVDENCTVHVGHLPWFTGKLELLKYFSQFGSVADIRLNYNLNTGFHRGYAFITFKRAKDAGEVIKVAHSLDGVTLVASPALGNIVHSLFKSGINVEDEDEHLES